MKSLPMVAAIASMLDVSGHHSYANVYDHTPVRTRFSHTKPFETTAAARARKKAERQRKKAGRAAARRK